MDPDVIADLAMMLGIEYNIFEHNIVEVAAKVKRNGGDVDDAAAALDAYLKKLFEEYSGESGLDDPFSETASPSEDVIQETDDAMCQETDDLNVLPRFVDAPIGKPTIRDEELLNPLPNAYYAVKYHGYAKCSNYFKELLLYDCVEKNKTVNDFVYQYDPRCLVDWLPLKGYKPGTIISCKGNFLWQSDGTLLWDSVYPDVGLNSEHFK